jgi:hypothetical protein
MLERILTNFTIFEVFDGAMFICGLVLFIKGFRIFREYRVLADMPELPIHSIAMGLVEVHGEAQADGIILSPVSQTPCCFYKVKIEVWVSTKSSHGWNHYKTDIDGPKFFLVDDSGKAVVDARGAELDLPEWCKCTTDEPAPAGADAAALHRYVARLHAADGRAAANHAGDSQEAGRAKPAAAPSHLSKEFLIRTMAAQLFLIEKPLSYSRPQADSQDEGARQTALEAYKHPPGSPPFMHHVERLVDAEMNAMDAPESQNPAGAPRRSPRPFLESMIHPATGLYRFTEYLIHLFGDYDVTATCVENPHARGETERNLLTKGTREPTFLISSRTEKEVDKLLRARSVKFIFGGGALIVAAAAGMIAKYVWL